MKEIVLINYEKIYSLNINGHEFHQYQQNKQSPFYYTLGLKLWYLMPFSIIFQLYRGDQFYWWRKLWYPEKTTDLQVTDPVWNTK